jgi:hypothetical protein
MPRDVGFKQVLVAFDGSENALRACEVVANLAKGYHSQVTILHVIPSPIDGPIWYVLWAGVHSIQRESSKIQLANPISRLQTKSSPIVGMFWVNVLHAVAFAGLLLIGVPGLIRDWTKTHFSRQEAEREQWLEFSGSVRL